MYPPCNMTSDPSLLWKMVSTLLWTQCLFFPQPAGIRLKSSDSFCPSFLTQSKSFGTTSTQPFPFPHPHECTLHSHLEPSITSLSLINTSFSVTGSFQHLSSYTHLWWLVLLVNVIILAMSCNPEGTSVIQTLRLEDTDFWSRSWGRAVKKTLGPGKAVHTFNLDYTFCCRPTQGQWKKEGSFFSICLHLLGSTSVGTCFSWIPAYTEEQLKHLDLVGLDDY